MSDIIKNLRAAALAATCNQPGFSVSPVHRRKITLFWGMLARNLTELTISFGGRGPALRRNGEINDLYDSSLVVSVNAVGDIRIKNVFNTPVGDVAEMRSGLTPSEAARHLVAYIQNCTLGC